MEGVGEWASNLSLCLCRSTIAKDLELLRVVDFNCQDEVKRSLGAYMPPQLADDVPVYANLSSEGRRCSVQVFVPVPVNTEPEELLLHKSVPVVLVANRKVLAAREDGVKNIGLLEGFAGLWDKICCHLGSLKLLDDLVNPEEILDRALCEGREMVIVAGKDKLWQEPLILFRLAVSVSIKTSSGRF